MEAKEKPSLAHIDDIDSLPSAPRKCCTPPEAPMHKVGRDEKKGDCDSPSTERSALQAGSSAGDDRDSASRSADSKPEQSEASSPVAKDTIAEKPSDAPEPAPSKPSQHLDTSKEPIAIVMRAVSFVYRRMVAKPTEGGLKDFFEQNWKAFDVEDDEHRVEWTVLYKDFEALIDKAMSDFAASEGLEVEALFDLIRRKVDEDDKRISKFADMLIAAGSYTKFVQMMKGKAKSSRQCR